MSTKEIVASNSIIGVAKHIFSCLGINIAPEQTQHEDLLMELPEVEDKED